MFWFSQKDVNLCIPKQKEDVQVVLQEVAKMITRYDKLWVKGASFDYPILKSLFNDYNVKVPWNFRNESCIRSFLNVKPKNFEAEFRKNNPNNVVHNALDDAIYQVNLLNYILNPKK